MQDGQLWFSAELVNEFFNQKEKEKAKKISKSIRNDIEVDSVRIN